MTILRPDPTVGANHMTWVPEKRIFVHEISSIGGRFGRVYDDACDEGMTLVSQHHPYRSIVLVVEHTEVRDGDILYWDLKPADPRVKVDFGVRIYND